MLDGEEVRGWGRLLPDCGAAAAAAAATALLPRAWERGSGSEDGPAGLGGRLFTCMSAACAAASRSSGSSCLLTACRSPRACCCCSSIPNCSISALAAFRSASASCITHSNSNSNSNPFSKQQQREPQNLDARANTQMQTTAVLK